MAENDRGLQNGSLNWMGHDFPRFFGDMVLIAKPARQCGNRWGCGVLLACALAMALRGWSQNPAGAAVPAGGSAAIPSLAADSLAQWEGLPVRRISYEGVAVDRLRPIPDHLAQAIGTPLTRDFVKRSLRQLYSSGLFDTIQVTGAPEMDGVALVFAGTPRIFIGIVTVDGAKSGTVNTQLLRASQLASGTRFSQSRLAQALEQMRRTLAENGFHDSTIEPELKPHPEDQLEDIAFHVIGGPQARVGAVEVTGDPGMSADEFRRLAHLKPGARVEQDTGNRALAGVLKRYQRQNRLEAEIKLESQQYDAGTQKSSFRFAATGGPVVRVLVSGASMSAERVKHVIPIFEEGTVDDDLLNEGNRRLRDYYQRKGYFDVKVDHEQQTASAGQVAILFKVALGPHRRVDRVTVAGNRYFDAATLKELLSVHAADAFDRHGAYSQTLVNSDINALQALYQNNGFSKVRITADTGKSEPQPTAGKTAPLTVVYRIEEGDQQRVGSVKLEGTEHVDAAKLMPLLNTAAGQLVSPQNLAGDRDALLTEYLSRGFDQVRVDVTQQIESADASKVDVVFHITEGQQIFVRKVLVTGLHFTRPATVAKAITLHSGDPLNQTALAETDRKSVV